MFNMHLIKKKKGPWKTRSFGVLPHQSSIKQTGMATSPPNSFRNKSSTITYKVRFDSTKERKMKE